MRSLHCFPKSGLAAIVMAALLFVLPATAAAAESFNDALEAYSKKDYQTAFQIYKSLAEQGNPRAQNNLGNMYDTGQGVDQDLNLAAAWYKKAAEQDHVIAQYNLGNMYDIGQGLPQNFEEAKKWYTKAAENGYAKAQHNLGDMYSRGKGVEKDPEEAAEWYQKAADQGFDKAQFNLGHMYKVGEGVAKDPIQLRSGSSAPPNRVTPRPSSSWAICTTPAKAFRRT